MSRETDHFFLTIRSVFSIGRTLSPGNAQIGSANLKFLVGWRRETGFIVTSLLQEDYKFRNRCLWFDLITKLALVTVIVRDQDEAVRFFTEKLGFVKRSDDSSMPGFRWLTVSPKDQRYPEITLLKPGPPFHDEDRVKELLDLVGKNPTWTFNTDDCRKDYADLKSRGVKFLAEPEEKPYGIEALFEDLYGNMYSLVEAKYS
jgi:catechol 2,3-dioxygenase-like lactoylglutathione lyase family enzyme